LKRKRYIKRGNKRFGPFHHVEKKDGKIKSVSMDDKYLLEAPDYPKHLERKVEKHQKRKEKFNSFLNNEERREVIFASLITLAFVFVFLIASDPSITGLYLYEKPVSVDIDDMVASDTDLNITVDVNKSGTLKLVFPNSWKIADPDDGLVSIFDKDNYKIEWDVNESDSITLSLTSPDKAVEHTFRTILNNVQLSEKTVRVVKKIIFNVLDSSGNLLDALIRLDSDEFSSGSSILIKDQIYKVEIEPKNNSIKKIVFKNLDLSDDIDLKIEDNISLRSFSKIYAIDSLEFESAVVTSAAVGNQLFKCSSWHFTEKKCYGEWENLMSLDPGELYSFVFLPGDPAFAEKFIVTREHDIGKDMKLNYSISAETYVLDKNKLDIKITNEGSDSIQDLSVSVSPKKPEKIIFIHPRKILGWGNFNLLGFTIERDITEPLDLDWGDDMIKYYSNLDPGRSIETEFDIQVPLTAKKQAELVLNISSGEEIIFQKDIIVYIKQDDYISLVPKINYEENNVDIYILILNKEAYDDDFNIEFNLNFEDPSYAPKSALSGLMGAMLYGSKTIFVDFFGPYSVRSGESLLLAQRYKFKDDFANNYIMHAKLYNSDEEIIDSVEFPLNLKE